MTATDPRGPVDAARRRTVTWEDPAPIVAAAADRTGLELMRAIASGALPAPPIARLLGFDIDRVDDGNVVFSMEPIEAHQNPLGTVHGGIVTTLLDSAMGCAVHTTLPRGGMYTTLELKVNFLRPSFGGGERLLAEGTVLNRGSTAVLAEATITGAESGKKVAHATSTCLILGPR
ncbi:MAG TPA: PaaI family thioesterase [Baekduia sp.]|uniref:PaaI family thioesterase n=1 Tax=Baekduia sp. TaxID=2600305 RepID=UPI002D78A2DD|nr:PaaI family thioesterase [Baekduia sp.]HET6505696.1 PaaI family thioesterase [Baekduia sp.]